MIQDIDDIYPEFEFLRFLILTRLIRLASKPTSGGPSTHFKPSVPFLPGTGLTRRSLP